VGSTWVYIFTVGLACELGEGLNLYTKL